MIVIRAGSYERSTIHDIKSLQKILTNNRNFETAPKLCEKLTKSSPKTSLSILDLSSLILDLFFYKHNIHNKEIKNSKKKKLHTT